MNVMNVKKKKKNESEVSYYMKIYILQKVMYEGTRS